MKKNTGKQAFFKYSIARAEAIKKAKKPGANNKYGEYIDTKEKKDGNN